MKFGWESWTSRLETCPSYASVLPDQISARRDGLQHKRIKIPQSATASKANSGLNCMITSVLRKKIIFNHERKRDPAPEDWESASEEL